MRRHNLWLRLKRKRLLSELVWHTSDWQTSIQWLSTSIMAAAVHRWSRTLL